MIVVNRGGVSYKHTEPASVGQMWCGNYEQELVCITGLYGNLGYGPVYIDLCIMDPKAENYGMHITDFYAAFHKMPAPAAAN